MITVGLLCTAGVAHADATPSLAFEPVPAGDRGFGVERAGVRGHLLVSGRVTMGWGREPLTLENEAEVEDRVVSGQMWMHAGVSLSLWHRLVIHADMPFVLHQSGDAAPASGGTAPRLSGAQDVGDLRAGARVVLFASPEDADVRTEIALSAAMWFPTATEGYAGDGSVRGRGAFVASGASRKFFWAFNGGVRSRPGEELDGVLPSRVGTSLVLGGAAGFFVGPRRDVALGAEGIVDLRLGGGARAFDPRATVGQFLLTGHWRILGGPFEVGAAFGPGFARGPGAADYRILGLVGYAPETPPPPPDRDEDGVPDKIDACPDLRGVPARDPLLHGCPEAPPDRDGDGIPDQNDACPKVPGEATGVRATHGCPRPPPEEKPIETPMAALQEQAIVITQQVQFETGTAVLRAESDAVLSAVARVLAEHPEIELVEVQGHTDDIGTPELNRKLGQDRAESVTAWLVAHGVSRARLVPKGHGADRPLTSNATEEGRGINRRVELKVVRTAAPPSRGAK
ncbi:outer membrane protein OmpA [Minicystis rosea]|nr:outer membrane protein OmpA [Minicystis rosea]